MTTHFDPYSIHGNALGFNMPGHDDSTMICMLQDLPGIDPRTIPVDDKEAMQIFSTPENLGVTEDEVLCKTGTFGVPELGTGFMYQALEDTKPTVFSELVRISGLSRGAGMRLGNVQELIKTGIYDLSSVIGCRDNIMVYLMYAGLEPLMAFEIVESVRKDKGLAEEMIETMKENEMPDWYLGSCLRVKYMFPKAHVAAYTLMAIHITYFKVCHSLYYYTSHPIVRTPDFDLITMIEDKTSIRNTVKDIYSHYMGLGKRKKDVLIISEIMSEMAHQDYRVQPTSLEKSQAFEFIIEGDTLIPPFISVLGLGENVAKRIVETRDDDPFLSREGLNKRAGLSQRIIEYLGELGSLPNLPDKV